MFLNGIKFRGYLILRLKKFFFLRVFNFAISAFFFFFSFSFVLNFFYFPKKESIKQELRQKFNSSFLIKYKKCTSFFSFTTTQITRTRIIQITAPSITVTVCFARRWIILWVFTRLLLLEIFHGYLIFDKNCEILYPQNLIPSR